MLITFPLKHDSRYSNGSHDHKQAQDDDDSIISLMRSWNLICEKTEKNQF